MIKRGALYWNTFGFLWKHLGTGVAADWVEGNLNMAPRGAGYLIVGGYLQDTNVFFCPTSEGGYNKIDPAAGTLNHQNALKTIGRDPQAWQFGPYDKYGSSFAYAWTSSYDYRCQPSLDPQPETATSGGGPCVYNAGTTPSRYRHDVPYTKPAVRFESSGSALFKTQKLLGERALMSDHWGRDFLTTSSGMTAASQSHAYFGHGRGEGYNVLYGDYSAGWYGDPQLRILWWPWSGTVPAWWKEPLAGVSPYNKWYDAGMISGTIWCVANATTKPGYANLAIWHEFDKAHGVDVGVTGPAGE